MPKWNKPGPLQAAVDGPAATPRRRTESSVVKASLDSDPRVDRVAGADPWLAASLTDDLFETRFLWSSDCGRLRFAALGEKHRVPYHSLGPSVEESARELDLRGDLASHLPLALFVLGETDQRPRAFDRGEAETHARCWTPQVLLLQEGNGVQVFCPDEALRHEVVRRLEGTRNGYRAASAFAGCEPKLRETPLDSRETWCERVETALETIDHSPLEKVVVSRRLEFEPERMRLSPRASTWHVSHAEARTAFSISTDSGESCFIAATPETLLQVRNGTLITHALAGTRPRDASLEDFLASSKLTREHEFVSDGMVGNLAPYIQNMQPGALRVRRSGSVSHLETPLSGDLRSDAEPLDVLSVLHPTAAIGGWPRQDAQEALQQIEPYSRGWFAAPVGWIAANGDMHAAIAIRSLWVTQERAVALAGAGIVKGSVANDEWAETEDKFDNMRAALRGQIIAE